MALTRYQQFFQQQPIAACLCEIIYQQKKPIDYHILDFNSRYQETFDIEMVDHFPKLGSNAFELGFSSFLALLAEVDHSQNPRCSMITFSFDFPPHHAWFFPIAPKQVAVFWGKLTQEKNCLLQLQEEVNLFRSFVENTHDMVYRIGIPDGQFQYVNAVAEQITGYPLEEILHQDFSFLEKLLHPDWKQLFMQYADPYALAEIKPVFEFQIQDKSGQIKWIRQQNFVIYDSAGKPIALEGIAADITATKNAETKMERHLAEMQFLAESATHFLELVSKQNIFDYICSQLFALLTNGIILVQEYDATQNQMEIKAHCSKTAVLDMVIAMFGRDPRGLRFTITKDRQQRLASKSLHPIKNDISEMSEPGPFTQTLKELSQRLQLNAVYEIGIMNKGEILGEVVFLVWDVRFSQYRHTIETFVNQAATALQKHSALTALQESEALFRSLHQNIPGGMLLIDQNYRIQNVNSRTCQITGYSRDELVGQLCDIVCPKGSESKQCPIWEEGLLNFEGMDTTIKCKNGYRNPILKNAKVVIVNGKKHILEVFQDTKHQKEIEAALRESKEKYSEIFNGTTDAIFIHDAETGDILNINRAALAMYGYSFEEFLQLTIADFSSNHPPYTQADAQKWLMRANEEGPQTFEWHARRKDGSLFWIEVSLKRSKVGKRELILASIRDISDRKKAEGKLIEAQKMDSIGNLAGGVAHDFNNMLAGIIGYAGLLLQNEEEPQKRANLTGILKSAQCASDLTQKLLGFGRRGKNLLQAVNLNHTIQDVFALLERTIDDADEIQLQAQCDPRLFLVDADPSQMNQMLMNLCVNAKEAMSQGGILTVQTKNQTISLDENSEYPAGEYVVVKVMDNGHGIDEEIRKHIFEPFFTTKIDGNIQGTGLGLSTVYGIVKNHMGYIDVESFPGEGTIFTILLPRGRKNQIQQSKKISGTHAGTGTILIVEDNDMVRDMAEQLIQQLGYETLTAVNGREGVEIFRNHHHEITGVILDMRMPFLGGKETFIQMQKICPTVRVLIVTGYGHNEEAQEILDLGACGLIAKPFQLETLAEKLSLFHL